MQSCPFKCFYSLKTSGDSVALFQHVSWYVAIQYAGMPRDVNGRSQGHQDTFITLDTLLMQLVQCQGCAVGRAVDVLLEFLSSRHETMNH